MQLTVQRSISITQNMAICSQKPKCQVKTTPFPTVQWLYLVCCHVTAAAGLASSSSGHVAAETGCRVTFGHCSNTLVLWIQHILATSSIQPRHCIIMYGAMLQWSKCNNNLHECLNVLHHSRVFGEVWWWWVQMTGHR